MRALTCLLILLCVALQALSEPARVWPQAKARVVEVKPGEGPPVAGKAAVEIKVHIWKDEFDGVPLRPARAEILILDDDPSRLPGLRPLVKKMRVGQVARTRLTPSEIAGLPQRPVYPQEGLFIQIEVLQTFKHEPPEWLSTREGSGERSCRPWDRIRISCHGWTDDFRGENQFYTTPLTAPLELVLAKPYAPLGWQQGLSGMKAGEVRRLKLPYYLGKGCPNSHKLTEPTPLFFEIELLEFVD